MKSFIIDKRNIYIDNINMKDYNIEYLRKRIGFIAEEPVLNKGSIISNIIYDIDSYDEDNQKDIFITYIYIY